MLSVDVDRDSASRLGISLQAVDDTLYDAFGQRQVATSFTAMNYYRVVLEATPAQQASPDQLVHVYVRGAGGTLVPLPSIATGDAHTDAAGGHAPGTVPRHHALLQPGAQRRAGGRGQGGRRGDAADRPALGHSRQLPGDRAGVRRLAVERALAHRRRAVRRLRRARNPVREPGPPDHDPLHAAVGRAGRAGGALRLPHRLQHHRAHRRGPAARHREEERHHDDRLRARGRATRRARARPRRSAAPACCASVRS